ncbi:MAG: zinc ABC transporter substrate-binding protein [Oscillospiraceae bacterium]|nr:zinc ABC transporter substrate-binding protein [Oscillospiraceae bacterium]
MKKTLFLLLIVALLLCACGQKQEKQVNIAASTRPMAQFASLLTEGTGLTVQPVVTEAVSCLHDYTLSVAQMKTLEQAEVVILSGGDTDAFLQHATKGNKWVVDASRAVSLWEDDPHYWLDPVCVKQMVTGLAQELSNIYPQHKDAFVKNLVALNEKLDDLVAKRDSILAGISMQGLVTFHDGFRYFARFAGTEVLAALEEEHGSEVSAKDLENIILLVKNQQIPVIFVEENGSDNAAKTVAKETGATILTLSMCMGTEDYFSAMEQNLETLKEAFS